MVLGITVGIAKQLVVVPPCWPALNPSAIG